MGLSILDSLAMLPDADRVAILDSDPIWDRALTERPWWAVRRPEQEVPAGDWLVWLILTGRGWGKSRTGSETLADWIRDQPLDPDGKPTEWAIIAEKYADARDVCMEGPSGFLNALTESEKVYSDAGKPWNRSQGEGRMRVPHPDKPGEFVTCKIYVLGAEAGGDTARGLNLAGAWLDELAKWKAPSEAWDEGILPALRVGRHPRAVVTTTPKPKELLLRWVKGKDPDVHTTHGSIFDNAQNLAPAAIRTLLRKYRNTRLGRQELYGELLEEMEGALWTRKGLEDDRVSTVAVDRLARIVVAIDPAVTNSEDSDETGIIVAGLGMDGHGYVLEDLSGRYSPEEWARKAIEAYRRWGADKIIGEVNNGGDLVERNIRAAAWEHATEAVGEAVVPAFRQVRASRGKSVRAQPVAALYEQHKVHHVGSEFKALEDQQVTWVPPVPGDPKSGSDFSPDRMDALVWAITDLMLLRKMPKKARRLRS